VALDPPIPSLSIPPLVLARDLCVYEWRAAMDDQALINRANRAYSLSCRHTGAIYRQPAAHACRVNQHDGALYVVLANGCGGPDDTLAVYRCDILQDRLRRLKRWPSALDA